jgi:hypothetical protein
MGNTISEPNGELYDTVLSNMVNKWALNKYTMDLPNNASYQNLIKKRACCTKQTSIPISIPSYDEQNRKLEFSSVNINVFSNEDEITPSTCSFENDRFGNKKQYYFQDNNGFIISNQNCAAIYPTICNSVLKDRQNNENDYTRHYGGYPDTKNRIDLLNKVNTFIDCNCKNSLYLSDVINAQTVNNVNPNSLAQSLDTRCSMNSTKTFKTIDDRIANLCLNNINVTGDIGVNNDAQLGITQTCGSSSQKAANPAVAEQVNPVSPVSPNTSTPDEATPDAGTADAGTADEATPDAGTADAATPPVVSDEGTADAATPPVVADAATPDETTPDEGTADAAIMQTSSSNTKIYIIVGVVILICIIAIIFFMKYKKNRL